MQTMRIETMAAERPGLEPAQGLEPAARFGSGRQLKMVEGRYLELLGFLWEEAATLDRDDTDAWVELFLAPDIIYVMPVCLTRRRHSGASYESAALHFDEDYLSLKSRVRRNNETPAWAADPPPRARRFVTSVRVWETGLAGHYDVSSSLLVVRTQDDEFRADLLTAERRDLIRIGADGVAKLARRKIIADQTTIGMHNLAIFL
jgi:3-phenylpropionate/cinnamic acid dioxygenase small subunit